MHMNRLNYSIEWSILQYILLQNVVVQHSWSVVMGSIPEQVWSSWFTRRDYIHYLMPLPTQLCTYRITNTLDKNLSAPPRDFCNVHSKVVVIDYVLYCSRDAFKFNSLISTGLYLGIYEGHPTTHFSKSC